MSYPNNNPSNQRNQRIPYDPNGQMRFNPSNHVNFNENKGLDPKKLKYLRQVRKLQAIYGLIQNEDESINMNQKHNMNKPKFENINPEDVPVSDDELCAHPNVVSFISSANEHINKVLTYEKMSWPIWEIGSVLSKGRERKFVTFDSLGLNNNEMIVEEWIVIGNDRNTENVNQNKTVSVKEIMDEVDCILLSDYSDVQQLIKAAKNHGIKSHNRAMVWQLVLDYLPSSVWERGKCLDKKRREYYQNMQSSINVPMMKSSLKFLNEIIADVPRTKSSLFPNIFELTCFRRSFERVLFTFASLHKHIGYFLSLNEIASILYVIFLENALSGFGDIDNVFHGNDCPHIKVIEELLITIEPDVFYCMSKMIEIIHVSYPFEINGVFAEKMNVEVENIIKKVDKMLWDHIESIGVTFMMFMFRWLLCLLARDLDTPQLACLWDYYLLMGQDFPKIHVYTSAALLLFNRHYILSINDIEDFMAYILKLPTKDYTNKDILNLFKKGQELKQKV